MTAVTTTAPAQRQRRRTVAYWTATAVVVGECAVGGTMDLFRMPPFYPLLIELGYPSYLSTMLGTAKILAAVVLLARGLPLLKEWAYAGVMINMVGAAVSNAATHQPVGGVVPPAAFGVLALLSWAARPPTRRLARPEAGAARGNSPTVPSRSSRTTSS